MLLRYPYHKRAVIELQFNWIFILIAGGMILIFFMGVVSKQKELSEKKVASTILTNLDAIFTGAKVSIGTVNLIDIPKEDIKIGCNEFFVKDVSKSLKDKIVFAPNILRGYKVITWALDWNVPYRVVNFLYLTTPWVRYIIVHDSNKEMAEYVYNTLPKELNKELVPVGEVENKNNYKVKFVFVNTNPNDNVLTNFGAMPDDGVKAIRISFEDGEKGEVEFYVKKGNSWSSEGKSYFLMKASLIGAIFASDKASYECGMKKAFKRLNIVTRMYKIRATDIKNFYKVNKIELCEAPYFSVLTTLLTIMDIAEELSNTLDSSKMSTLYNKVFEVKHWNQVAQLYSCAMIY